MLPFGALIISVLILICLFLLHNILPESDFSWIFYIYIFPVHEQFCHCSIIISAFVLICWCIEYMFLHWYFCVFYTIYSLGVLYFGVFVVYLSCSFVIIPLLWCYIWICMNMFFYFISIFTSILLCAFYYLLLGCTPSWEACHMYFLYIIHSATVSLSLLTWTHDSWLTYIFLNLPLSFCMHWNRFCSWFLNISYICFSFKYLFCFLILGKL